MASFSAQIRAFCPRSGSPASGSPALQVVTAGSGTWDLRAPDMNGCAGWIECHYTVPPCSRGWPRMTGEAPQTRPEGDVQQCLCDPLRRVAVAADRPRQLVKSHGAGKLRPLPLPAVKAAELSEFQITTAQDRDSIKHNSISFIHIQTPCSNKHPSTPP